MDIYTKRSPETIQYTFDFTPELGTGETVSSVSGVSQYEDGATTTDLTIGSPTLSSPNVQVLVGGGTVRKVYVLECTAVTSAGQTLIVQGAVAVI